MRYKDVLFCEGGKDGGPESKVFGFWLIRVKSLFTIALLRFDKGSREAFHSHAFNCISWIIKGSLEEHMIDGLIRVHKPSFIPIVTRRTDFHKVYGRAPKTWVFTIRGPWNPFWKEYLPNDQKLITLTHNRVEVDSVTTT